MRIRFTIDITRTKRRAPDPEPVTSEPEFEHRDNDTLVETTLGGDPERHRMGFVPAPTGGED